MAWASGDTVTSAKLNYRSNAGPVFNLKDPEYGAVGDSVTDDTSAISAALAAAQAAKGTLFVPEGEYVYSSGFTITDRVAIVGAGKRLSFFRPDSSYSGFFLTVDDCWRNNQEGTASTSQSSTSLAANRAGVELREFSVIGDRANRASGIRFYSRNDNVFMSKVGCYYLNGKAFGLGSENSMGLVRESTFNELTARASGNTIDPAVELAIGTLVGDGTNQLHFVDCEIIYSYGIGLKIHNSNQTHNLRRVSFDGLMLHGHNDAATAPAAHLCTITGDVDNVQFHNLRTNGSHVTSDTTYACISIDTLAGNSPAEIDIHGDIRSCQGHGIEILSGGGIRMRGTVNADSIDGSEVTIAKIAAPNQIVYDMIGFGTRSASVNSVTAESFRGFPDSNGDVNAAGGYRQIIDGWHQSSVSTGQSWAVLSRFTGVDAADAWIAPRAGSVTGLAIYSDDAINTGTITVRPFSDASFVQDADNNKLQVILNNSTFSRQRAVTTGKDVFPFSSLSQLDLRINTSSDFTPETINVIASLEVET
jgi:hypothetical protein